MISVGVTIRDRAGAEKPAPTIHIKAESWSPEVLAELFAVLCERAGAIGGLGLLRAHIRYVENGLVQLIVMTGEDSATSDPISVPADVLAHAGFPVGVNFNLPVRVHTLSAVDILDLHFPVFAGHRVAEDKLEPVSPDIYGTAFPVWHGGLFATAAHVLQNAMAVGEVVLGRFGGRGPDIPGFGIEQAEIFPEFDLALFKCPALERFPPVTLEMETMLDLFDEVRAVGYAFSVDPEYRIAVHRGFAGHVVACRQLYNLPGQPWGYELSFQTPPGMSGAPLMHVSPDGKPRCYGFIVQQMETVFSDVHVRLGIAVSTLVLRNIRSKFLRREVFSEWFGVASAPGPARMEPKPRRGGENTTGESQLDGWPDDDPG